MPAGTETVLILLNGGRSFAGKRLIMWTVQEECSRGWHLVVGLCGESPGTTRPLRYFVPGEGSNLQPVEYIFILDRKLLHLGVPVLYIAAHEKTKYRGKFHLHSVFENHWRDW